MKHFNKALTATVLSGALVFSAIPAAGAEEQAGGSAEFGSSLGGSSIGGGSFSLAEIFGQNREIAVEGVRWYLNQDGKTWVQDRERINETPTAEEIAASAAFVAKYGELLKQVDLGSGMDFAAAAASWAQRLGGSATTETSSHAEASGGVAVERETSTTTISRHGGGGDALAQAAAIALPAIALAGGMIWYLNQDGRTYVIEQSRVRETPTDSEREASAQMIAAHGGLEAAAGDEVTKEALSRGVSSETGSNTLVYGLLTLVIASLIGAGVFFGGRRFILN